MSRVKRIKKKNLKYKIIWSISFIVYAVFLVYLFILDMLPTKYLLMGIIPTALIYFITMIFMFNMKIKKKIKVTSSVFLIIFMLVFGVGIKYMYSTVGFLDAIDNKLFQRANYYVMVLDDSKYDKLSDLKGKKMGIYSTDNSEEAVKKVQKKVKVRETDYTDVEKMIEDLKDNKIESILINDSAKSLIDSELDLDVKLRCIGKVSIPIEKEDIAKKVDITKKKFNIFIAGGDAYGSIKNVTNTDVNMIVSIDPVKNKILLTSIPRDYYVNLPSFGTNAYDKLTHAGYYGIEESVKTVEKLLDTDINYYVKVNFSTVEGVIDAIGGVDVDSDYSFKCHNDAQTRYYSFKAGNNHLNGEKALAFARERHSFPDGDVQRVKNQQKVIAAVIDKATSSTKIITNFTSILDSVKDSMSTNMNRKSINKFVKKQLNEMKGWKIESQNLTGFDSNSTSTYSMPGMSLYVMKQDPESVKKASEKIEQFMGE